MTDKELVDQYLANGGTIKQLPSHKEVFEPYQGKLQKSHTKPVFNSYGERIYQNLDKTMNILPTDETMLNYGE